MLYRLFTAAYRRGIGRVGYDNDEFVFAVFRKALYLAFERSVAAYMICGEIAVDVNLAFVVDRAEMQQCDVAFLSFEEGAVYEDFSGKQRAVDA